MEKQFDVIIMGGGAAGLYGALNLDKRLRVLVLTKQSETLSNSSLAQGGIAAVTDTKNDSVQKHINDTLVAGGFRNDRRAVEILTTEGPADVMNLAKLGVDFDLNEDGTPNLTLEGGHTRPRILHHKDCTGKAIVDALLVKVHERENITLLSDAVVCEIKKTEHTFHALVLLPSGEQVTLHSRFFIIASGGIGRVYEYTTNSAIATGDGITLAYRMSVPIKNLHFVQFHPTAFANRKTRESFLISESVRGEGAYLLNCHGNRFMHEYDERLELAPRDVVSRSIMEEAKRTGSDHFYLDITYKDPDFIRNRFPLIYENLKKEGIDMTTDRIPVFPCQHYLMGGIQVDSDSQTTIPGLFACGECSHTGVHGANRLASNSLLEAVVFSRRAAAVINEQALNTPAQFDDFEFSPVLSERELPHGFRTEIRAIMQHAYFVAPDFAAAKEGLKRVEEIKNELDRPGYHLTRDYVEARSLAYVAYIILKELIEE